MKSYKFIGIALLTIIVSAFTFINQEHNSPTKWISFEEAVAAAKKNPRPILVDVYTQWCGPCKLMSKNTFGNEKIAKYLNENFYCVKFDAEGFDTVRLATYVKDTIRENGKIIQIKDKPTTITFTNFATKGTPKSPHQFAYSILDGKLQYPSFVFLSPTINRLEIKAGYHPPELFEPILKYYGSGAYQNKSFDEFNKTFKTEF